MIQCKGEIAPIEAKQKNHGQITPTQTGTKRNNFKVVREQREAIIVKTKLGD